jgi:hypothetical protein
VRGHQAGIKFMVGRPFHGRVGSRFGRRRRHAALGSAAFRAAPPTRSGSHCRRQPRSSDPPAACASRAPSFYGEIAMSNTSASRSRDDGRPWQLGERASAFLWTMRVPGAGHQRRVRPGRDMVGRPSAAPGAKQERAHPAVGRRPTRACLGRSPARSRPARSGNESSSGSEIRADVISRRSRRGCSPARARSPPTARGSGRRR